MYRNTAFPDDFFAYTGKWHELTDSPSSDSVIAIGPQTAATGPACQ
jgi:hypothetical protein